MPPKSKQMNGNGNVSLEKVFSLLEQYDGRNAISFNEVKLEVSRSKTELLERIGDMRERLVKIETQPAHEQFQRTFCPNTKGVELMVKWIEKHERWHEESKTEAKQRQVEYIKTLEGKFDERNKQIRNFFFTAMGATVVGVINVVIQLFVG